MGGHHLIMGELKDFITARRLPDTHDERYRQQVARWLVESKGYPREQIHPRVAIDLHVDDKSARIRLDFMVKIENRIALVVKYGPGSLVTRHQVAYAAAMLLSPYIVPFSIVTNGEDAHWLDNQKRRLLNHGFEGIWDHRHLRSMLQHRPPLGVSPRQAALATRILFAYEVDGRCPCDDTVCEFESRTKTDRSD